MSLCAPGFDDPYHTDIVVAGVLSSCDHKCDRAGAMSNSIGEKRVLSIQSHVVHGYVGNRAATFPLQVSTASVTEP